MDIKIKEHMKKINNDLMSRKVPTSLTIQLRHLEYIKKNKLNLSKLVGFIINEKMKHDELEQETDKEQIKNI